MLFTAIFFVLGMYKLMKPLTQTVQPAGVQNETRSKP